MLNYPSILEHSNKSTSDVGNGFPAETKKPLNPEVQRLPKRSLVAGSGFEPLTFGL
jgi:hypothetical protein